MWWWIGTAAALVVLIMVYLSATAGRLDRLHHRVDASREALDAQLASRAAATLQVSNSGLLDPASSLVLADAAAGSLERESSRRWGQAESDLSAALAAVFSDESDVRELVTAPGADDLVAELSTACHKVEISRRFHNDAVRACQQVRRHHLVRLFRLAGRTDWPETAEFDAAAPVGFTGR